jgi:hypothetical protein
VGSKLRAGPLVHPAPKNAWTAAARPEPHSQKRQFQMDSPVQNRVGNWYEIRYATSKTKTLNIFNLGRRAALAS